jgi:transcriptional regulator GlxA family with amidase domain
VVRDGNILTGGGVTAGIDFALTLAGDLAGREAAEAIQLMLEYNPAPPFSSGRPRSARPAVLARVEALMARSAPERKAAARRAADALARV